MKYTIEIIFFFLVICIKTNAQDFKVGIQDSIVSAILGESREINIVLPKSYAKYSYVKYPVTYVLDGDFLIQSSSGMIEYMSKTGQIPEMIIVYVSNTNRTRDFTPSYSNINYQGKEDTSLNQSGGGKKFLKFLNLELIPYIDGKYNSNSYNTIVGRSLGGLIASYDFLQESSKLTGYILIDPSLWWNEKSLIFDKNVPLKGKIRNKRIYIASSDNFKYSNDVNEMRISQELFYTNLKNNGISQANAKLEYFENYTHGTVTIPSFYNGMLHVFKNFYLEGMKYKKADDIINHFTVYSKNNNAHFFPLEPMINWLASLQNVKEDSIKLYEFYIRYYPTSLSPYFSLAKIYEKDKELEKALVLYRKILKLDTKNAKAIEKIKELNY